MKRKKIIKAFLFVICSVIFLYTDMIVGQSTLKIVNQLSNEFSPMAKITFNPNINVIDPNYEKVKLEQVHEIANLDEVQEIEYSLDFVLFNQDLKNPYDDPNTPLNEFIIIGASNSQFVLLKEELILLKEGRSFNEEELMNTTFEKVPVLISEEFASINHLTVGSDFCLDNSIYFIPLYSPDLDSEKLYVDSNLVTKETYNFNVIGIFTQNKINGIQVTAFSNHIFTPETFVELARNFYFTNAHNAHKKVYQNESWWDEIEEGYQFNLLNQKASTTLFILKDATKWNDFEAKANAILMPSHQVKRISTVHDLVER
ncbi:hypothetical protein [Turicibacter sanguinis]|uniref:hypothetical protein n=1 Tax=Turicibacter sanguinis TaxID=154288 RepID=UPI0006C47C93|nr:hypothetical protein [Turicibacter sanguinis]MDB8576456.1 hypothetical protein [Turicibacter sanguinis]MDB8579111.1 hypothetical protein [Turicibacter sanguinis]MDB8585163.1 hypothetical protein [Turicibacter sanguinis]MDB8587869.1 hypothetical protein [Turicibacter sanguinis]MDB8598979.1 hypothetical protein [Turicibacter sanguinis]